MIAMRVRQFGGPEAIVAESLPLSRPDEGEILIRVKACGVGPWDGWIRSLKSVLPQALSLTLGSDVSGQVVAFGAGKMDFRMVDPVYGVTNKRFTDAYPHYAICVAVDGAEACQPD